jgi:hypothetical protein
LHLSTLENIDPTQIVIALSNLAGGEIVKGQLNP